MQPDSIAVVAFLTFVSAGLSTLLWSRLNRMEETLRGMATSMATKEELNALRAELRAEIGELRADVRRDIASLRSDITQVALAVGASKPQASEG